MKFLGDRRLVGKPIGEEVRRRFPRLTMSLVMAVIFYLVNIFVPPLMEDIPLPGINLNAGTLVGTIALIFTAIFLIRALADGLVLSDILTDIFVKRLGIKEERSPRRAARDAIYIIVIILVATALFPLINTLEQNVRESLSMATTYVALAIILILIYDIGRILYRIVERKAESVADSLAKMADRRKNRE
jgi:protein-S-isoprenylcysteine O-methyltransferase Ste14